MQTRNSLDYTARTTRGFNDTSASIFQNSQFELPKRSVRNSYNTSKNEMR